MGKIKTNKQHQDRTVPFSKLERGDCFSSNGLICIKLEGANKFTYLTGVYAGVVTPHPEGGVVTPVTLDGAVTVDPEEEEEPELE